MALSPLACLPLVVTVLICALSACGGDTTANTSRKDGQIVFAMAWEPVSFYPLRALDSASYYAQTLVNEGLIKYDSSLKIVAGLAESFSVSDDGLTYRFRIRPGLKFSSGEALSESDIVSSIELAMSDASPYRSDFEDVARVEAVAPGQIVLRLTRPCAPLLSRIIELRILPRRLTDLPDHGKSALSRQPVGTGPFRLEYWQSGLELAFEPNPHYWGQPPLCRRLVWRVVTDPALLCMALGKGEIDVAPIDGRLWQAFLSRLNSNRLALERLPGCRTIYLGLNARRYPLSLTAVRQALSSGIDRAAIVSGLYAGFARQALTDFAQPYLSGLPGPPPAYDPASARRRLVEAGVTGLAFPILTVKDYRDVAEVVAQDLRQLGIACAVQVVEFAALRQRYLKTGQYDAVVFSRSVGPDPECTLAWGSRSSLNFSGFGNAKIDELLAAGRRATRYDTRIRAYQEIRQILAKELPFVFLCHPQLLIAHDRAIENIKMPGQERSGLPWDNPLFNASCWSR